MKMYRVIKYKLLQTILNKPLKKMAKKKKKKTILRKWTARKKNAIVKTLYKWNEKFTDTISSYCNLKNIFKINFKNQGGLLVNQGRLLVHWERVAPSLVLES